MIRCNDAVVNPSGGEVINSLPSSLSFLHFAVTTSKDIAFRLDASATNYFQMQITLERGETLWRREGQTRKLLFF